MLHFRSYRLLGFFKPTTTATTHHHYAHREFTINTTRRTVTALDQVSARNELCRSINVCLLPAVGPLLCSLARSHSSSSPSPYIGFLSEDDPSLAVRTNTHPGRNNVDGCDLLFFIPSKVSWILPVHTTNGATDLLLPFYFSLSGRRRRSCCCGCCCSGLCYCEFTYLVIASSSTSSSRSSPSSSLLLLLLRFVFRKPLTLVARRCQHTFSHTLLQIARQTDRPTRVEEKSELL